MTDETRHSDETEFHLPEDHAPLPELIHLEGQKAHPSGASFESMLKSPEYQNLRSTFRGFAIPMTIAGLLSYFTYVVLSIYLPGFMGQQIGSSGFNWGIVLGLFQFFVTYTWTALYVRFANTKLDQVSAALKENLEKEANA